MAEIDTTKTFVPGDSVTADIMNNIIDEAFAKPEIITGQTAATPVPADDYILFYDASATLLKKCKIDQLPNGVTSINWKPSNPAPTAIFNGSVDSPSGAAQINFGMDNQGPGKVLAGPISGSAATPTFRVLSPSDLPVGTVSIALHAVDWDLGSTFYKAISGGPFIPTFTNASPGQTIRILVRQDTVAPARAVTWSGITGMRWPGGTDPVLTTTLGAYDLFTISYINGLYLGTFDQNFLP